ncbi:MAG: DUF1848 domain-containing protein [Lachnospiraceae bacterium]|nr:DUF1848 domain-containing protein [Lachnospiraceae bacterium]
MIVSASRRTDIPCYYSEWFYNRIKEGFLYVRNPMNFHQVSRIDLSPEIVDCIVFWTKNPKPMMSRLEELGEYKYYFQFTLTGYGRDIEPYVPHKKKEMIPVFRELSHRIGSSGVIWRYDPILFNDIYTEEYHIKAFAQIAGALKGYTKKCVISFVDIYSKNKRNMTDLKINEKNPIELAAFAGKLSEISHQHGIQIATCAENIDLQQYGIEHNCCIDKSLIEEITGCKIQAVKDKNQRKECGCIESVEIGTYDSCKNGCRYCYANYSSKLVKKNSDSYDEDSPLLCGKVTEGDKITERKLKLFRIL